MSSPVSPQRTGAIVSRLDVALYPGSAATVSVQGLPSGCALRWHVRGGLLVEDAGAGVPDGDVTVWTLSGVDVSALATAKVTRVEIVVADQVIMAGTVKWMARFAGSLGTGGTVQYVTGPQGPQGDTGPKGDPGDTGPKGDPGDTGPKGDPGDTGPKGDPGDTGPKGDPGDTGPKGDPGDTGPKGDPGDTGPKGDPGDTGPKGDPGDTGPKGDPGDTGPKGDPGDTGPKGDPGDTGPKGDPGTTSWDGLTDKPSTFPPASHKHAASDIDSGIIAPARLGTGTPDGTKFLRDDGSWVMPPDPTAAFEAVLDAIYNGVTP